METFVDPRSLGGSIFRPMHAVAPTDAFSMHPDDPVRCAVAFDRPAGRPTRHALARRIGPTVGHDILCESLSSVIRQFALACELMAKRFEQRLEGDGVILTFG